MTAGALLALGWITTALADADGEVFDGDELALPIVLGVGVLAFVLWKAFQRRSPTSPT